MSKRQAAEQDLHPLYGELRDGEVLCVVPYENGWSVEVFPFRDWDHQVDMDQWVLPAGGECGTKPLVEIETASLKEGLDAAYKRLALFHQSEDAKAVED